MDLDDFQKIVEKKPLIHHITNDVTINDCANITLNWGGLPVMAPGFEEVDEMVELASALVLNIGTITSKQIKAMIKAGKKANKLNIPVILDPVGAGATKFRTEAVMEILKKVEITVLKGNIGEISVLAGKEGEVKGVEAIGEYKEIKESAKILAKKHNSIVTVSGKEDIVTDGNKLFLSKKGHPLMGEVVGTGCMLASTLGVFAASKKFLDKNIFDLIKSAVFYYGVSGEKAALHSSTPAKYKTEFLDSVYKISRGQLKL
ncbi:MAG: hydroxyethylthiazole kinase [Halanaerobiales bacterium]